jgi:hypothetical protein
MSVGAQPQRKEGVGRKFDLAKMRFASRQAWKAVEQMAAAFQAGLRESEAQVIAQCILDDLGMDRIGFYPVNADTSKKADHRQKGVSCPSEESSAKSSSARPSG